MGPSYAKGFPTKRPGRKEEAEELQEQVNDTLSKHQYELQSDPGDVNVV